MRLERIALALAFLFLLVGLAPASAENVRRPHPARQMYDRGWQWDQERIHSAPALRRSRRSEAPPQVDDSETAPAEKLDDARVVLVVGDFMASGLAAALADDYAQAPKVRIVDGTNGSSGLVRSDFYDWPKEIGAVMDAAHPSVVVMMIGANDRQPMDFGGTKEPARSDAWTQEYVRRVEAVTKAVTDRKIPLVWVGQPAFRYASMSSDMLALDDIYQRVVEAAKGEYVDIWDGFVDENGAFRFTGPDVNGQPVRLRSDDGITLSKAGKRKVAFYVEKPLNRMLGAAAGSEGGVPAGAPPGPDMIAPSLDRTQPVSLAFPPVDGSADLLGSKAPAKPGTANSAIERLTIEGIPPSTTPGRADDFGGADDRTSAIRPPLAPSGAGTILPAGKATLPEAAKKTP
ncbi:MAG: SGNH/GDSL hydrolase family protein [Rhizobiaceae bacterium]